jgi:hypothetical protein
MWFGTYHPNYILQQVDLLLKRDYGIELTELLTEISKLLQGRELPSLQEFVEDRIGTHGAKMVESSVMIGVEQWLISAYTELSLK